MPTAEQDSSAEFSDSPSLVALRAQMLRFAAQQLRDLQQAEDVVQEALMGALTNRAQFRGDAAFRTWVFAILRRKIIDSLRRQAKEVAQTSAMESAPDEDFSGLFDASGHWATHSQPKAWADPDAACEDGGFWRVFQTCLEDMPEAQARYFMMREFLELETKEICSVGDISESNLNVVLYRARLRLRECLSQRWFEGDR